MVRAELLFLIAATASGLPAIAFADEVPSYDVRATCRVEAQDVTTAGGAAGLRDARTTGSRDSRRPMGAVCTQE
ncbi:MAG TPA: hypothetical protein VH684_27185 [Xanthobacteraceae bacterium]|jgi:hypothetical protein